VDNSPFQLPEVLDAPQVAAVYRAAQASIDRHGFPERIDLAHVRENDSSAIALLLEWRSQALARGQDLQLTNPPTALRMLADLSQVGALLGWSASAPEQEHSA